jgi:tetratricopeptide (TPR) repeat protein
MRWKVAALAGGVVVFAAFDVLLLSPSDNWAQCTNQDPETRIVGCTTFIEALGKDPVSLAKAFFNRGLAHEQKGRFDHAIDDYDQAVKFNPKFALAFAGRGEAYYAKRDYDRAIQDYDRAVNLDPTDARAFGRRGVVYLVEGQYDRAIEDFDHAIKLKPDYAAAFADRGAAYSEQGQYDRAIEDFERALALDPRNAAARNGFQIASLTQQFEHPPNQTNPAVYLIERGNAYAQMGQTDRAIRDYDHAIKLDPHDITALWRAAPFLGRGNLYAKTGQYDRAIQDYDEAIRLSPNDALAFSARGDAFRALGQQDRAVRDFAEVKRLNEERTNEIGRQTSVLEHSQNESL